LKSIKTEKSFYHFKGSNLGFLCKTLRFLALGKIVRFEENNINLIAYNDGESLVWKMLEETLCNYVQIMAYPW